MNKNWNIGNFQFLLFVSFAIFASIIESSRIAAVGLTEEKMMEEYGYCSCRTLEMKEVRLIKQKG